MSSQNTGTIDGLKECSFCSCTIYGDSIQEHIEKCMLDLIIGSNELRLMIKSGDTNLINKILDTITAIDSCPKCSNFGELAGTITVKKHRIIFSRQCRICDYKYHIPLTAKINNAINDALQCKITARQTR